MKTTPNPSATKNSSEDELPPPLLLLLLLLLLFPEFAPPPLARVLLSVGEAEADVGDGELEAVGVAVSALRLAVVDVMAAVKVVSATCLTTTRAACITAESRKAILPETIEDSVGVGGDLNDLRGQGVHQVMIFLQS